MIDLFKLFDTFQDRVIKDMIELKGTIKIYEIFHNKVILYNNKLKNKIKELDEEIKKYEEKFMCNICYEYPKNVLFMPCKHFACCDDCSDNVYVCCICRENVKERIRIYD